MNLTKKSLTRGTRKTLGVILSTLSLLIIGCEDSHEHYDDIEFEYALVLPQDDNGYYRMSLGSNWQTTQRLTGTLTSNHSESRADYLRDLVEKLKDFKPKILTSDKKNNLDDFLVIIEKD